VNRLAAALLATALAGCRPGGNADLDSLDPGRRAAAVRRLADPDDASQLAPLLAAQQDPHPGVRAAAATALGIRGGDRSLDTLSSMLADPDPAVVSAAARALATLRTPGPPYDARLAADASARAGRALAEAYGRVDFQGRREIAAALDHLGAPLREAVEAEARQLLAQSTRELRTGTPGGRAGAAEELGRSGRAEAVKQLVALLEEDEANPDLAAAAARGLGGSRDRVAVPPLEAALESRWAVVAESAAWALGAIGDPQASDALGDAAISAPLRVGRSAVSALAALPPAPGVGVSLCEVALRTQHPEIAEAAASAARERAADCPDRPLTQRIARGGQESIVALSTLGALGLPPERLKGPAEKAVSLISSSGDARTRAAAARALGLADFPAAVPALQRRLASADAEELGEVAVALARLAPEQSGPTAARLAASVDPRLRIAAARCLSAGRQPGAAAALGRLAVDPDGDVRRAAHLGLGSLGGSGVGPLGAALALRPTDPGEVEVVVRALGSTGDPSALPLLSPFLAGAHAAAAAVAIGRLGDPAGVATLVAALQSGGSNARLEIVEALDALGAQGAGEALSTELLGDRASVRAAAARALGKLRYEPASRRLDALRSDYDADVRRAAREALSRLPVGSARKP